MTEGREDVLFDDLGSQTKKRLRTTALQPRAKYPNLNSHQTFRYTHIDFTASDLPHPTHDIELRIKTSGRRQGGESHHQQQSAEGTGSGGVSIHLSCHTSLSKGKL